MHYLNLAIKIYTYTLLYMKFVMKYQSGQTVLSTYYVLFFYKKRAAILNDSFSFHQIKPL